MLQTQSMSYQKCRTKGQHHCKVAQILASNGSLCYTRAAGRRHWCGAGLGVYERNTYRVGQIKQRHKWLYTNSLKAVLPVQTPNKAPGRRSSTPPTPLYPNSDNVSLPPNPRCGCPGCRPDPLPCAPLSGCGRRRGR